MPRRNSRAGSQRHGSKGQSVGQTRPIDWEAFEAPLSGSRPKPFHYDTVKNEFTRNIVGFSPNIMRMLTGRRFEDREDHDQIGFFPVSFRGVSQLPTKRSEFTRPSAFATTKSRLVILSGIIEASFVEEIGKEGPITQIGAPELKSHGSALRLNLTIGPTPHDFDGKRVTREMFAECKDYALSEVSEINGTPVPPNASPDDIDQMWERR